MLLPRFEVFHPETLNEACRLLENYADQGAAVLAGGTDILVDIRKPIIPDHLPRCKGCDPRTGKTLSGWEKSPKYLIALSHIPGLSGIIELDDGEIGIGCLTTISEICRSSLVRNKLTALAEGADNLGSPLVRNRGTIGGNICNARPAADALVPTFALAGRIELVSLNETRVIPVEEFVVGPGKTTIKVGEVLSRIIFPQSAVNTSSSALKLANRKALEIAVVNTASMLSLDAKKRKIQSAHIALGAVGPAPILALKAADYLIGKEPSESNFLKAGEIATSECRPITDHRGSAIYRMEMVKLLVKRTLLRAWERIVS